MDHLPAELVSDIFRSVVEAHSTSSYAPTQTWSPILLLNRSLRDIALSTPDLWTSISLKEPFVLDVLRECLLRSKACELDVIVEGNRMDPRHLVSGVFELKHHISRWSTFNIDMGELDPILVTDVFERLSQTLAVQQATALKSLGIAVARKKGDNTSTPILQNLLSSSLSHLSLHGVGLDWTISSFPRLRTLKLHGLDTRSTPSFEALEKLLSGSPHMAELELVQVHMPPADLAPATLTESYVPLHLLQSLTLKDVSVTSIHHILSRFSLPHLEHLTVGFHSAPDNLLWSDIPPYALESVVNFEWCSTTTQAEEAHRIRIEACLEALLYRLNGVKTFHLAGSDAFRRLSTVSSASSEDLVLPNLYAMECSDIKGMPVDALLMLVKGRPVRLERLSVSAVDFSMTASVGQRILEAADDSWNQLERTVGNLTVKDRQDHLAFRYTFVGWKDYQSHLSSAGRQLEYEEDMEE